MDVLTSIIAAAAFSMAAFYLGRLSTKSPSEDVMMDRLVIAATERRMLGVTKKAIEEKIETRVRANLKQT